MFLDFVFDIVCIIIILVLGFVFNCFGELLFRVLLMNIDGRCFFFIWLFCEFDELDCWNCFGFCEFNDLLFLYIFFWFVCLMLILILFWMLKFCGDFFFFWNLVEFIFVFFEDDKLFGRWIGCGNVWIFLIFFVNDWRVYEFGFEVKINEKIDKLCRYIFI